MPGPKRLTRDKEHGLLGGVATGMAHHFDLDPVVMRVIFVLALLLTFGTAVLAYIILWVIIPDRSAVAPEPFRPPPGP